MKKIKVGIIAVTGYIGMEIARLLNRHQKVKLSSVTGRSAVGRKLGEVFPHLTDTDLTVQSELGEVDFVFSALPHGTGAKTVGEALKQGIKVIDVSADFRLNNPKEFEEWYKVVHPVPELLGEAVYGLPELNRERISQAKLIANPGCYAASIILALAPAVKEGLIENDIVVDSKSGVSGAGRTLNLTTHFAEANESVSAYALDGHRHLPEIVQELGKGLINQASSSEKRLSITFLPHLIPMTRGILSSCYAKLAREVTKEEVIQIYQDFYRNEPFTHVVGYSPATKQTLGTNLCLIHPTVDLRTNHLIVISVLDNLIKGGAGQAIQNMNLMLGFPETTGLEGLALYP